MVLLVMVSRRFFVQSVDRPVQTGLLAQVGVYQRLGKKT